MSPIAKPTRFSGPRLNIGFQRAKRFSRTDRISLGRAAATASRRNPGPPIASGDEPTEEALDFPDKPKAPLTAETPLSSGADADFFVPANPGDLASSLVQSGPTAPPMLNSATPGLGTERPYAFGSNPGGVGPFLGPGLFYPASSGISGGGVSAGNSNGGASSSTGIVDIPVGIAIATPEPGTVPLLLIGVLLGSPALLRRRRNRPDTNPGINSRN